MSKTTKELLNEYNALAKAASKSELKYWKESKDKLQKKIDDLYEATAEKMIEKSKPPGDTMSAAQWARALSKNPKVVRAKLRKHGLGVNLKEIKKGSEAHKIIVSIITVEK